MMHGNAAHPEQLAICSGEGALRQVRLDARLFCEELLWQNGSSACVQECGGDAQGLKARGGVCR
jgi:hypothetical protein